jgi:hypothetical protein
MRVRSERDRRAIEQRVGMGACEGEGRIRELRGEPGLGGAEGTQVVGGQADDDPVRDDRAVAVTDPVRLHGALETPLDLDRSKPGPEKSCGLALEEPFEKPLDGGKGSHVGGGV